ncbi:hypothetical protein X802_00730 [Thermococcus guaymasensis DSM 11113]|uniref:Uncharacterized protein n=1 Tax=Thermococcus guaymasensis DSM 11113 TaxID=1432656 RepID=A0A0X1KMZ1_9EURY|nr:hypothetical protein X802_00730 [Thermococcus guaymasensis DSM 11113]
MSLLAVAGMFIFGGKKKGEKPKKKTWDEELEEFAKKYGLPKENVKYIAYTYLSPSIGFLKILARASPDGSYKRVAKALSAEKQADGYILRGSTNTPITKK